MLIQLLTEHPSAAIDIAQRTPVWVWGLWLGLTALGLLQWRTRERRLASSLGLPIGLGLFAFFSLGADFAQTPWMGHALLAWLLSGLLVLGLGARRRAPAHATYDAQRGRLLIPGSALPLLWIQAIFWLKYAVGVELVLQPALRDHAAFAIGLATAYGLMGGALALRSAACWRLARSAQGESVRARLG